MEICTTSETSRAKGTYRFSAYNKIVMAYFLDENNAISKTITIDSKSTIVPAPISLKQAMFIKSSSALTDFLKEETEPIF